MLDVHFVRENFDLVREKLSTRNFDPALLDNFTKLDGVRRSMIRERDELNAASNRISKEVGALMREGKKDEIEQAWKRFLEDKATKYGLHPISMGMFGGVFDYNKMNVIIRKTMGAMKQQLEADGFKENPAGVYDTRDWKEICEWAKNLVLKARYL